MENTAWQEPAEFDNLTEFVFLCVDVIGHSKLYPPHPSKTQMRTIHELLDSLRKFVESCIPGFQERKDLSWGWASDGGIFAFPSSSTRLRITDLALDCAIRIADGLSAFNEEYSGGDRKHEIALHISLDRGQAYFVEDPGMRRSDALNVAAKLKSPTGQTAILVTERIRNDLSEGQKKNNFGVQEPLQDGTAVYTYLPVMAKGMGDLGAFHAERGQWIEAAHCHYRCGRYMLAHANAGGAATAFALAVEMLKRVQLRHRYFYLTLKALYESWSSLSREGSIDTRCDYPTRNFFETVQMKELFKSTSEWRMRGNLMIDMELISEQLDLLCAKLLNFPAGLSTLETALLLERLGYSSRYFGDALGKRLDRIEADMKKDHHRSIDGDCSMCSGAALSALTLGHSAERADELREWLRRQGPRYCQRKSYTGTKSDEHALQYAGNVLQGFLDVADASTSPLNTEIESDIKSVVEVFFPANAKLDDRRFFQDWMKHRNIDAFEVCTYVLPVFARYVISGRELNELQRTRLTMAVDALADALRKDVADLRQLPGRLYWARENLGSFALGMLIGMSTEAEGIAEFALGILALRAQSDYPQRGAQTIDSNLDRTRRFLEGWLLQWEAALYARDQVPPLPVPDYVERLMMTFPRTLPDALRDSVD